MSDEKKRTVIEKKDGSIEVRIKKSDETTDIRKGTKMPITGKVIAGEKTGKVDKNGNEYRKED